MKPLTISFIAIPVGYMVLMWYLFYRGLHMCPYLAGAVLTIWAIVGLLCYTDKDRVFKKRKQIHHAKHLPQ